MTTRAPFQWDNANFSWDSNPFGDEQSSNPFTWDDVALIKELAQALGGHRDTGAIRQTLKNPEKKKRFIKLLCIVNGEDYKKEVEIKKRKIVISEVELVVKEISSILKIEI